MFNFQFNLIYLTLFFTSLIYAQNPENRPFADGVAGVVGNKIILKSEVEFQKTQMLQQGIPENSELYCMVWQDLLFNSLLMHRAQIDSVEVTNNEIEQEIDRRLQYFMMQMRGSEEEFKKNFGKTVLEFKDEIRPLVKNNILARKMRNEITEKTDVTPKEVRAFFQSIPKDSLPVIEEEYKIAQIVIKPKANDSEKIRTERKLREIREQIVKDGKDFGLMALVHSQDPGSSRERGEIGFITREQLVPEFSAVAFNLQPGEISDIVETDFGFHIIQMIERKGNMVNVRHILRIPEIFEVDMQNAKYLADSLYRAATNNPSSFKKLATKFSDDENTKLNGGRLSNPQSGDEYLTLLQMGEEYAEVIKKLRKGEISKPVLERKRDGSQVYKMLYLEDKIEEHIANFDQDYNFIKKAALEDKKDKVIEKWIHTRIKDSYIRIPSNYRYCKDLNVWYQQSKN
jgi:peptidyl-prolyl cis-trans isomerase SurA